MRLSEIYTSVQGEGPDVGRMTQFVRFAGCNLRCPGWPCDTQHAIDPSEYRHEWETVDAEEIAKRVGFHREQGLRHVTLTGGEPFLQSGIELEKLVETYLSDYNINIFTNGTLRFPKWIGQRRIKVIMDWKLPGSGEMYAGMSDANGVPIRLSNLSLLGPKDALKFVCINEQDFWAAHRIIENHPEIFKDIACVGNLYVGVAWGKMNEAHLVRLLEESGNPYNFKLNVQIHNYIFDRNERGI